MMSHHVWQNPVCITMLARGSLMSSATAGICAEVPICPPNVPSDVEIRPQSSEGEWSGHSAGYSGNLPVVAKIVRDIYHRSRLAFDFFLWPMSNRENCPGFSQVADEGREEKPPDLLHFSSKVTQRLCGVGRHLFKSRSCVGQFIAQFEGKRFRDSKMAAAMGNSRLLESTVSKNSHEKKREISASVPEFLRTQRSKVQSISLSEQDLPIASREN
jgi:hypothetical protein